MSYFSKRQIPYLVILFLLVTNISTVITTIVKNNKYIITETQRIDEQVQIPSSGIGRFFRDQLDLNSDQHFQFRDFRKVYHKKGVELTMAMQNKRIELLNELAKEQSDTLKLHSISEDIGSLHADLKHETFHYYLNLKSVCTKKQKNKLFEIFKSILNTESVINLPINRNFPTDK